MTATSPPIALLTLAATLMFAWPAPLRADQDLISEQDLVDELPLVTGAARMAQPLSTAPASVTIIDRAIIDAAGAQSWIDLFRLVAGFQTYSVNGNRVGIDYHGLGREFPNHLEVMVDGRSVYEPLFSSVEWNGLGVDLADIDHIEIVRGTNAPSYGSNAFLGAVNIVTRQPIQDRGLAVRTSYGSRHTRNVATRYNSRWGDLDYRLSLGYYHNEGFPAIPAGANDDGKEQFSSSFRGTYTPNATDSVEIQLGYNRNNIGYGDPDHPDEYIASEFDNHYQGIKWHRSLNTRADLQLHLYHNRLDGDNRRLLGSLSELVVAQGLAGDLATARQLLALRGISDGPFEEGFRDIRSERSDIELQHSLRFSPQLRSQWGLGVRAEDLLAEALLEPHHAVSRTSYRLFGSVEWQSHRQWVFNAGLMLEHNRTVGTIASPRITATYLLDDRHSLRLGAARGNRSPSLLEANEYHVDSRDGVLLNAIRRSAADIGAEKLDSLELGLIGNYLQSGLSVDARLYYETIRDGLENYQQPIPPTISGDRTIAVQDNLLASTTRGAELQLRYQPRPQTLIAGQYAYSSLTGDFLARFEPEPVRIAIDNHTPGNTGSLLLSQQLAGGLVASGVFYYQDAVTWVAANKKPHRRLRRVDLQLSYQLPFGGERNRLSLSVQNLGSDYADFDYNNRFATGYYLKLELELP